jgi:dolichol-phosphate mannosyltransferase
MPNNPDLSIVLPVYNEAAGIARLISGIAAVMAATGRSYEMIAVDDASSDTSCGEIEAAFAAIGRVSGTGVPGAAVTTRLVKTGKRSGQSSALMTGYLAARGAAILSMDADGQYDPADIPRFIDMLETCDMVCGRRKNRTDGIARKAVSLVANGIRNLLTGDSLSDAGCTFRIMRSSCRDAVIPLQGKLSGCEFFFHPLFVRLHGYRIEELPVIHKSRVGGRSNYPLFRGRWFYGLKACLGVRTLKRQAAGSGLI